MKKKKLKIRAYFVNFLTHFRIIAATIIGFFLYFFSKTDNFSLFLGSFFLFIIGSFSDLFDGFLSRRWNVVTEFGKIFDPITDKILTTTTFFFLAYLTLVPWFLVLIFVLRDIIIDGFRIFLAKKNVNVAANFWGKLKTILQIGAILTIFTGYSTSREIFQNYYYFFNSPVILACLVSLISGFIYLKILFRIAKIK
ncbi:CDP-diacylglycerol--glycerol-3-phosphate 3-phosphatidyltransferase [Mesomycoplasma hyopneumoniae]|uniref:CDP-diacylglycerol--glycerol-3-phosphate 3-phosphatidyltransferase n=2 Tax=Mesomycoplasma hyopneumoniae (strain 168) TaxID=907287 RepID=E4QSV4_MESH1|nr:CDP-diacylglycerol--glycerol-3-phosphate 3-phosphatidyltransferase [Mesomycoplasma hyopneumoniae]ADQ90510.1 CDP-diacylglycerol--glycerol-3-phosphate 3-phosphatidyltransferase [Mesomycoplasma hyopneumoniae 168]AGM22081.1 CDP-diacylglycerol--glycerol-3-phosphate 3-phosphatidyltransferase [Mesomycoplasma hyopneumoniae 168-L]OWY73592.1 CDP-diacylglycerol--glycerol-3-phosphate 3-phosphatidyltransferase [Mesomycoplasma hyopneumoniae]